MKKLKSNGIKLEDLYDKVLYSLQYIDYKDNQWTAPVILTKERAERFLKDNSVEKVRIITTYNTEWELDIKN